MGRSLIIKAKHISGIIDHRRLYIPNKVDKNGLYDAHPIQTSRPHTPQLISKPSEPTIRLSSPPSKPSIAAASPCSRLAVVDSALVYIAAWKQAAGLSMTVGRAFQCPKNGGFALHCFKGGMACCIHDI